MDFHVFKTTLTKYLIERNGFAADWTAGDNENLFDLGAIESFDLPHLVDYLEQISQRPADLATQRIEVFFTFDSMYRTFFEKPELTCQA